jgi:predicted transcriptional regulator
MILLERIRKARRARDKAETAFIETLKAAKPVHTFGEIADAAGLTRQGVRYFVNDENEKRRERKEARRDG